MKIETLLEGWSKVVRVTFRQRSRSGQTHLLDRDLLDRGDGVTVLLFNRSRRTVLLLKQPRIVATMTGNPSGETIEACNGLVGEESPEACALREVEEEAGHRIRSLLPFTSVYGSPGGSLECIHLYLAEYDETTWVHNGGGLDHEGEDIELIEVPIDEAMRWVRDKIIVDGRTILVLQHLCLTVLPLWKSTDVG